MNEQRHGTFSFNPYISSLGQLLTLRGNIYHFLGQDRYKSEKWVIYHVSEYGVTTKVSSSKQNFRYLSQDFIDIHMKPIPYYKRFYKNVNVGRSLNVTHFDI